MANNINIKISKKLKNRLDNINIDKKSYDELITMLYEDYSNKVEKVFEEYIKSKKWISLEDLETNLSKEDLI